MRLQAYICSEQLHLYACFPQDSAEAPREDHRLCVMDAIREPES